MKAKKKAKKKILLPLSDDEASLICDVYRSAIGGSGRERKMFERISRRIERLGGKRVGYKFDTSLQGHIEIFKRPLNKHR